MFNLLEETKKLLEENKGQWPRLVDEADVSYSFITHVYSGRIPNPGVNGVQRLYDVMIELKD